jgi:phosphatidylglycerol:prolipoprotein diacylglycerol transferase
MGIVYFKNNGIHSKLKVVSVMYPDLRYLCESIFKTEMPSFLSTIKTFGFFVAIAFLASAWVLKKELQRIKRQGLLQPETLPYQKAKKYLSKKEKERYTSQSIPVYPHQRVGEIVIIALIGGLIGAKIFNALESWNEFIHDPIGSLFSGSGLTFYGGLIVATILIYYYCRKHKIEIVPFCDAIAPALMLAYGIGRLGCHFSGDGDWGVFNSSYISLPDASIKQATLPEFNIIVQKASGYFISNFGHLNNVPHISVLAAKDLPSWLVAMNFPHNVNNQGVLIENCSGEYCHMLPVPVFPTSLYEAIICIFLFGLLQLVRNKFKYALHLFGLYLLLNGIERFFIEKIKVNYKYDWGFIHPAQSEIISFILAIVGILILLTYRKRRFVRKLY